MGFGRVAETVCLHGADHGDFLARHGNWGRLRLSCLKPRKLNRSQTAHCRQMGGRVFKVLLDEDTRSFTDASPRGKKIRAQREDMSQPVLSSPVHNKPVNLTRRGLCTRPLVPQAI